MQETECIRTVSDPLLLTVDNVVLAILTEFSLASQVRDITARIRLGDGQADTLVTAQDARHNAVNQLLLAVLQHWRASDSESAEDIPYDTATAASGKFVGDDELVELVPLFRINALHDVLGEVLGVSLSTHQTSQVTLVTECFVNPLGHFLCGVPVVYIWHNFSLDELSNLGAEIGVRLVEVVRMVLDGDYFHDLCKLRTTYGLVPCRVTERHKISKLVKSVLELNGCRARHGSDETWFC